MSAFSLLIHPIGITLEDMDKPTALSEGEVKEKLRDLPQWSYEEIPPDGGKIVRELKFKDFLAGLDFINKLAPYFEEMDHHPDITIKYNKIIFELQRWDIGGKVTEKDLEVASKIEKAYLDLF